jgi:predicted dehydrogenase
VYAQLTNFARPDTYYETEDTALITFRLPKLMGSVVLTRASHPKEEKIYIHGTKGTLMVNRQSVEVISLNGESTYYKQFNKNWSTSLIKQLDEFIFMVQSGGFSDSSNQLQHLAFLESIYKSQETGLPEPIIFNTTANRKVM